MNAIFRKTKIIIDICINIICRIVYTFKTIQLAIYLLHENQWLNCYGIFFSIFEYLLSRDKDRSRGIILVLIWGPFLLIQYFSVFYKISQKHLSYFDNKKKLSWHMTTRSSKNRMRTVIYYYL